MARLRKGMRLVELAKEMNVTHPAVSKWESNQTPCSTVEILRLARILDVHPVWLLTGEEPGRKKTLPLANSVREMVELSILIREGRIGEWEGDMVEVLESTPGDFCVVCPDDSMGDRPQRGDVVACTLDVRLADGAVVVLKVPNCDYPILRVVQKTDNGIRFVPRRMVQGKYVDRVYQEGEVEVLARALEIVRGKL